MAEILIVKLSISDEFRWDSSNIDNVFNDENSQYSKISFHVAQPLTLGLTQLKHNIGYIRGLS